MTTLLLAEHDNASLNAATAKSLTAALALNAPVDVLIAGHNARPAAEAAARLAGVHKVRLADAASLAHQLAEPMAALLADLAQDYDTLIAPATSGGKNIMPRVAALLDVMQVSDAIEVIGPRTFVRPIYAGNALQTVEATDRKVVATIRTAAFKAAAESGNAAIEAVSVQGASELSLFVGESVAKSDRPELTSARVVISGGRGLGSTENFTRLIEPVAAKLGAAVGASRAAVDAGYAANDCQVGQTGKIVAPDLYIACGISGAIQHLAGMKDSKVIVAINRDADAPIFAVADYGLVGDLFKILPELERALG